MDTDKLIVQKKIELAESSGPRLEYLVEGSAVGYEGLVPCVLDSETGDQCQITIADGPDTGVSATVSRTHLKVLDEKFLGDAASQLFK